MDLILQFFNVNAWREEQRNGKPVSVDFLKSGNNKTRVLKYLSAGKHCDVKFGFKRQQKSDGSGLKISNRFLPKKVV